MTWSCDEKVRVVSNAPGIGNIGTFDETVAGMYDVLISVKRLVSTDRKGTNTATGSQPNALVVTGSTMTAVCARTTPVIADSVAQNKHSERDIYKTGKERQAKIDKK